MSDKIHEVLRYSDDDPIHTFFDREDQARAYMREGDEYVYRVWDPNQIANPRLRLMDYRKPEDGGHGFWLTGFNDDSIWLITDSEKGYPGWPRFFRMDYATPTMKRRERQRQSAVSLARNLKLNAEAERFPLLDLDESTGLWCFLDCHEDSILFYAFFKSQSSAMTAWEISINGS